MRTLEQVKSRQVVPRAIRLANGTELIAEALVTWCEQHAIELRYTQPGKPDQNACIERFNRTFREEVLNAYLFANLDEVREIAGKQPEFQKDPDGPENFDAFIKTEAVKWSKVVKESRATVDWPVFLNDFLSARFVRAQLATVFKSRPAVGLE